MAIRASIRIDKKLLTRLNTVVSRGMSDSEISDGIKDIMRFGKGSINQQFRQQTTILPGGQSKSWEPKINPWGRRKSRNKSAGQESGKLKRAWLGGPGTFTRTTRRSVSVGVNSTKFPQINIMQGDSPYRWVPKRRIRVGNTSTYAARLFHGMNFNVWISDARWRQGMLHNPRQISMNDIMEKRAISFLEKIYRRQLRERR